ncbi:MAG: lysyl oxidase family protein [Myxococcota bacterium]
MPGDGIDPTTSGGPAPATGTGMPDEPEPDSSTSGMPDEPDTDSTSTGEPDEPEPDASSTGMPDEPPPDEPQALPDLDMSVVEKPTLASIYTETRTFEPGDCEVFHQCVGGSGERRLLRFSTITPNLGDAPFHAGNPQDNPDLFELDECGGGYLFSDYANYRIYDSKGQDVGFGHKSAFALIDLEPWSAEAGPQTYGKTTGDMGISVLWADVYDASLPCQYVDITGVAPGDYTLELSINEPQVIEEATFDNNVLQLAVTITADDDVEPAPPPPPAPAEWNCDAGYFGAGDGCDCGCGAPDPDCKAPTADACVYCDLPGSCATDCAGIDPNDNATCV